MLVFGLMWLFVLKMTALLLVLTLMCKMVLFVLDQLSITGGIVNALDALKLASTTKGERKSAVGSPEKPIKKSKKK